MRPVIDVDIWPLSPSREYYFIDILLIFALCANKNIFICTECPVKVLDFATVYLTADLPLDTQIQLERRVSDSQDSEGQGFKNL